LRGVCSVPSGRMTCSCTSTTISYRLSGIRICTKTGTVQYSMRNRQHGNGSATWQMQICNLTGMVQPGRKVLSTLRAWCHKDSLRRGGVGLGVYPIPTTSDSIVICFHYTYIIIWSAFVCSDTAPVSPPPLRAPRCHLQVEDVWPALVADVQQVRQPRSDQQGCALTRTLKQGVGGYSGAHANGRNAAGVKRGLTAGQATHRKLVGGEGEKSQVDTFAVNKSGMAYQVNCGRPETVADFGTQQQTTCASWGSSMRVGCWSWTPSFAAAAAAVNLAVTAPHHNLITPPPLRTWQPFVWLVLPPARSCCIGVQCDAAAAALLLLPSCQPPSQQQHRATITSCCPPPPTDRGCGAPGRSPAPRHPHLILPSAPPHTYIYGTLLESFAADHAQHSTTREYQPLSAATAAPYRGCGTPVTSSSTLLMPSLGASG
jgi:hypothetical protein